MRYILAALLIALASAGAPPPPIGPAGGTPIPNPTPTATPPITAVRDARAVWERPDRARITWLSEAPILCVDRAGPPRVLIGCAGGELVDTAPTPGTIYLLYGDTTLAELPLAGRALIPLVRSP